jgi:hypothetical protein
MRRKEDRLMKTVSVNSFVTRQIKGSGKSYAILTSYSEMALWAEQEINKTSGNVINGYRDGVVLVIIDDDRVKNFVSPLIKIDENTELLAKWQQRRPDEDYYIHVSAKSGDHAPVGKVELILYSHDVLAEDNEAETKADWELIAFNAIPVGIDKMPMNPVTMMRNQLHLQGGTQGYYSSEDWAEAIHFWQNYTTLD